MYENSNIILELNAVKGYYNKVFTNTLLQTLQRDIKVEDLIFSYNHYSNLLVENKNYDDDYHEISSDYLKSDDEMDKVSPNSFDKNKHLGMEHSKEDTINYFDPSISEETFEEKIEKTFDYLNNFIKSFCEESQMNKSGEMEIINSLMQTLEIEKVNEEQYQIFNMCFDKFQIYQITLIVLAYILRSIFNLSLGRKIIFSNERINEILLRALYKQNIYVQIFTLKNLKKYIIQDGEDCDKIHLKMIKICIFSKSLCSFNRAYEILLHLIKDNKQVSEIFDFYFLKKLKKSLENLNNIQRLRFLDLICDSINLNAAKICDIFRISKKNSLIINKEGNNLLKGEGENNHSTNLLADSSNLLTDSSNLLADSSNLLADSSNLLANSSNLLADSANLSADVHTRNANFQVHNFSFESEYEEEVCTFGEISYIYQKTVDEKMKKYNLKIKDICKMTKINIYKYLHMIYLKDDLLLKINVLEIFSKLIQNIYYCDAVFENTYFLHTVLNDLKNMSDEGEILHLSIFNSIISYSKINSSVLSFLINAHSNILMTRIIDYLSESSNKNNEKLIVGIKSFGFFFSIKQCSQILLNIKSNIHLLAINNINTHAHTNVLRHSINIWVKILPSKSMNFEWFKDLIHTILFNKIIVVLKEIDDTLIQMNIYQLLEIMITYNIAHLILKEQWLIRSLQENFENNSYDLKMSRYNFFKEFYQFSKNIIISDPFADTLIKNFIEKIPKRY
ncbi:hypothetical protein MKS88_004809 [Plasmodium brasilianum]|uniref:Uncharacterized protein n=2 Tax=Plasmodium (Plasmodium) TaxID=418103 RepID=A0A1A8W8R0_PLAMA|nr:conserved Plasmodium protein, unknown function [Plasmodium malariae]KAI4835597.1 hypothetical protein MKS88_004809 [Plasmodium brasilianum]SBS89203.1 conserved Plasmodium protein, unknown function [Plasmodium malariae]SCP02521.1 conserved Plasmodium protein, unknown function [Plasmodium malariae]